MKLSQFGSLIAVVFVLVVGFQNCAPPNSRAANDSPKVQFEDLNQLENNLKTVAESDLSCSSDADCKLVDVGAAPCGGPDYLLVASQKNPQYQSVLSLAQEYSYQDKIQTRPDLVGVCVSYAEERARCSANLCIKETL